MSDRSLLFLITMFLVMAWLSACKPHTRSDRVLAESGTDQPTIWASMGLTSTAFASGQVLPRRFTADGEDVSPPLNWGSVPDGTGSFVLIMDDPSAKGSSPWVHWVMYGIPGTLTALPEAIAAQPTTSVGAMQGKDSWGTIGYRGPSPPPGAPHQYRFRLFAIDGMPNMAAGMTAKQVLSAVSGHVLATSELTAIYGREVQEK